MKRSRRPSTNRAYARAWRRFEVWAGRERLRPLPASPVTVAAYLTHRAAAGLSMSSLAMDRKAISHHHRSSGLPTPTAAEEVRQTYAGLRNQLAEEGRGEPHQARGLTAAGLAAIRRTAHRPRSGPTGRTESPGHARRRGDVDIAIATVMRDALLRRSEAAELRWRAVTFMRNGSARVTVRRSKTSAAAVVLYVGAEAASALRRIRRGSPPPDERVFGLKSGRAISNRIAAMAREAGLGEGFSGHSPRVGMAQDLTAAGAGLTAIMVAGRWKSERMPAYYSRAEDLERGAVARFYGAGRDGGGPPGTG
ncbi:MAG: tyrosine-type recombinase/integrase [Gemmatimonadota bacterium]|nr:tyrosine-type recombinase/integrase [Gemmatimonadota bacterium]MDE2871213.1 tyrosine-type recombinase/integrase [Gemmatimonadota bacterium]